MDEINLLLLIAAALNLSLLVYCWLRVKKQAWVFGYAILVLTVLVWIFSMIAFRVLPIGSLFLPAKFLYAGASFIASGFLVFVFYFTGLKLRILGPIFGLNLILAGLVLGSDWLIVDVFIRQNAEKGLVFGSLYSLYSLFILFSFLWGFFVLWSYRQEVIGHQRAQATYFLLGNLITANIAFVTNLSLPAVGYFDLNWFGQIGTVFLVSFVFYGLVFPRLLGFSFILKKVVVNSLIVLTILVPGLFIWKLNIIFAWRVFLVFSVFFIVVVFLSHLKKAYYNFVQTLFFVDFLDPHKILLLLNNRLQQLVGWKSILNYLADVMIDNLGVESVAWFEIKGGIIKKKSKNWGKLKKLPDLSGMGIVSWLVENRKVVLLSEMKAVELDSIRLNKLTDLENLGVSVFVPLFSQVQLVGFWVLSTKKKTGGYLAEELSLLNQVSQQVAIFWEKANLYQQVTNFNKSLQLKVLDQTKELTSANTQLEDLVAMKSEFLEVVSHQLRTPLTALRGNLSMLKESFQDPKKEHIFLNESIEASNRLVYIVEMMILANELQGLVPADISLDKVDLEDLGQQAITHSKRLIKRPDVNVVYKLAKDLPKTAQLDYYWCKEALQQLLLNALKYTMSGEVELEISKDKGLICFRVTDSGVGLTHSDQDRLFQPFVKGGRLVENMNSSGLGLFVVQRVADLHLGKVEVLPRSKVKGVVSKLWVPK